MCQQRLVKRHECLDLVDRKLVECAQHSSPRVLAIDTVDDELRDHRVVQARDLAAGNDAGVDADPGAPGLAVTNDRAGGRQEAVGDVLGVDPALERVSRKSDVLLPHR